MNEESDGSDSEDEGKPDQVAKDRESLRIILDNYLGSPGIHFEQMVEELDAEPELEVALTPELRNRLPLKRNKNSKTNYLSARTITHDILRQNDLYMFADLLRRVYFGFCFDYKAEDFDRWEIQNTAERKYKHVLATVHKLTKTTSEGGAALSL